MDRQILSRPARANRRVARATHLPGSNGGSGCGVYCSVVRWFLLVAMAALAACLVGCGLGFGPGVDDSTRLHDQARAALARWTAAVASAGGPNAFAPVGDRTVQVGDWEEAVGDNNKLAMYAGLIDSKIPLSSQAPPDGRVIWPDGSASTLSLISAQEALQDIKTETGGSACSTCQPLEVVKADLTSRALSTSRGIAQAPVWLFSLQGTAVRLARVAVAASITVTPPAWDPDNPPTGIAIDSATGSVSGRQLTVSFVGAPAPGDQGCGADYSAEAVESSDAVVVIVIEHANLTLGACSLVGAIRTATVELAAPLGNRAVLDVQQGLPVAVTLAP